MDIIHIEAKADVDITLPEEHISKLPPRLGLITTIQHLHKMDMVKEQFPAGVIGGQILGCDTSNAQRIRDSVDAFLYIGSGRFHPLAVRLQTGKPVYTYDPFSSTFASVSEEDASRFEKKRKGALMKFLNARRIGILVTTKPGQNDIEGALRLKRETDKEAFIFISDGITPDIADSFRFIDCFVNTACPRISEDAFPKPIINIHDLPDTKGK